MKRIVFAFLFLVGALACADEAKLTWLGHAAFLYHTKGGLNVLIDPWLQNPKAPKDFKLEKVDAILVTHGHFDHVAGSFDLAKKFKAPFIASYELTEIAKSKGVQNVSPLNPSGSTTLGTLTITAVLAVHSSGFADDKNILYAGSPLGFVLQEQGSPTIYHAGDTGVFGDMALIKELYHPAVALLPIGGVFVMKPQEAAKASRLLGAKTVVPMHFGTFPALAGTPAQLQSELKGQTGIQVKEMTIGKETPLKELL